MAGEKHSAELSVSARSLPPHTQSVPLMAAPACSPRWADMGQDGVQDLAKGSRSSADLSAAVVAPAISQRPPQTKMLPASVAATRPWRRSCIGGKACHDPRGPAMGSKHSAELELERSPSSPPQTYSRPCNAAAPGAQRLSIIDGKSSHAPSTGLNLCAELPAPAPQPPNRYTSCRRTTTAEPSRGVGNLGSSSHSESTRLKHSAERDSLPNPPKM
mmetsp:Transcript_4350/g.9935  ORF Transcript_4350/g.9935 Transcript_4350/m.9935 type:complete len:216 (-) Transcript_4350:203-850(-)